MYRCAAVVKDTRSYAEAVSTWYLPAATDLKPAAEAAWRARRGACRRRGGPASVRDHRHQRRARYRENLKEDVGKI